MANKNVLIINSVIGNGSTGKIVLKAAKDYESKGYTVKIGYGRFPEIPADAEKYAVLIGSKIDTYSHAAYTRLTDKHGLGSVSATKKFLEWAEEFDPEILLLHNIHGYFINYELLFEWIKSRPHMEVRWTLHDCWSFTGHCAFFSYVNCEKWKTGCENCPQIKQYPEAKKDNCNDNYQRKKKAFTGVKNLTIVTPSEWLANLVKESFLKEYPVEVVFNTIDTNVFKPVQSSFKEENNLSGTKMLLGVANTWEPRKGLDDYIKLSEGLSDKETCKTYNLISEYKVVLIGLKDNQIKELNDKHPDILALPRTKTIEELVSIYSAADLFVNLTREDNYPTVNLEAQACGTPVITYDTGGSKETINRKDSIVVKQSVDEVLKALKQYENTLCD